MNKVSVAQLYKLTRLEIFVWSVSRHFFVNLFMHSPERYLNGQMAVTLRPKHLKRDQKRDDEYLHHFYMGVPPGMGCERRSKNKRANCFLNYSSRHYRMFVRWIGHRLKSRRQRFSVDFGLKKTVREKTRNNWEFRQHDGDGYKYVTLKVNSRCLNSVWS